jgi:hypothetical protein
MKTAGENPPFLFCHKGWRKCFPVVMAGLSRPSTFFDAKALDVVGGEPVRFLDRCWRKAVLVPNQQVSSPAQAGDPVHRGLSIQSLPSLEYWIVRLRGR